MSVDVGEEGNGKKSLLLNATRTKAKMGRSGIFGTQEMNRNVPATLGAFLPGKLRAVRRNSGGLCGASMHLVPVPPPPPPSPAWLCRRLGNRRRSPGRTRLAASGGGAPCPGMPFSDLPTGPRETYLQGCLHSPDSGSADAKRVFSRGARQNLHPWLLGCGKQVGKQ